MLKVILSYDQICERPHPPMHQLIWHFRFWLILASGSCTPKLVKFCLSLSPAMPWCWQSQNSKSSIYFTVFHITQIDHGGLLWSKRLFCRTHWAGIVRNLKSAWLTVKGAWPFQTAFLGLNYSTTIQPIGLIFLW